MDILVVDEDPPRVGVVETVKESENGRFSASRWPNNGNFLSSRNGKGEVPEDGAISVITKADVFESDGTTFKVQRQGVRLVLSRRQQIPAWNFKYKQTCGGGFSSTSLNKTSMSSKFCRISR